MPACLQSRVAGQAKSRATIVKAKKRIREVIESLQGQYPGHGMDDADYDSDGLEAEKIVCCVCRGLDCEEVGNDILLCDAKVRYSPHTQPLVIPPSLVVPTLLCSRCICRSLSCAVGSRVAIGPSTSSASSQSPPLRT